MKNSKNSVFCRAILCKALTRAQLLFYKPFLYINCASCQTQFMIFFCWTFTVSSTSRVDKFFNPLSGARRATLLVNCELQMTFYMKHKLIMLKNLFNGPDKRPQRAGFSPRAELFSPLLYAVRQKDQCKSTGGKAAHRRLKKLTPGVNFTNILRASSFYNCRSQKWKKTLMTWLSFALLGSGLIKATCKMLVKAISDLMIYFPIFAQKRQRFVFIFKRKFKSRSKIALH